MWTYIAQFKIALIPYGIDIYDYAPGIGIFKDDNVINKYLCEEKNASIVIKYLYEIYKNYSKGNDIYDIKYIENGIFECTVKEEQESNQWDIQDILWPDEFDSNESILNIVIQGEIYRFDLEVENVNLIKLLS
jgi:hypothetical protein